MSVSDGAARVTAAFRVTVRPSNTPPVLAEIPAREVSENGALDFNLVATDADVPAQTLTFSLVSGPDGLTVSPAGRVSFTPTEAQGPGTNRVVVRVTDSGTPQLSTTNAFTVVVLEVNRPPVLADVSLRRVSETRNIAFNLTATDADVPAQTLTFSLVSGPDGLTVSPAGRVSFTPTEAQGPGTNQVVVRVTDSGVPSLSTTNAFTVVVSELNQSPVLADVSLRRVSETRTIAFNLAATDADLPAQALTFSLVSGPAGLTVSPSGQVSFTPTEAQGPSTNLVVVRVTDSGSPRLAATNAFTVVVIELNQPPVLAAVADQTVDALKPMTVQLSATDADLPPQRLVFGLQQGPRGMTVDAGSGLLVWTPAADQASVQHPVTVSVSDGNRSVTVSFRVDVRPANTAPGFVGLVSRRIRELSPTTFRLLGRDTDVPAQTLTYGLVSGPAGLTVGADGTVNWTPSEEQGPSTNTVLVRVTDSGAPSLSTTNAFTLFVSEANQAPTIINAFGRSIFENAKMSTKLVPRDADLPAQKLTFTLLSGPQGLTLTEDGLMEWTPTEEQGPSTNRVEVRLTDDAQTPLSVTASFMVMVREANGAPAFPATNVTVAAQSRLSVALRATDADVPVQTLTYRLDRGPAGLTVSTNGLLEWTPPATFANTTNVVTVSVRDGVASTASTVTIVVRPVGSGGGSEAKAGPKTLLSLQVRPDKSLVLRVTGPAGARFRVESTTSLDLDWRTEASIGVIETRGDPEPVEVPLPAESAEGFRQFRVVRE